MSQSSQKKGLRKRVRPPEPEVDPEFQIAPMVDVLLVLLVFFMSISSTEVLQSVEGIDLPVARDAREPAQNPGQVIINIRYNLMNNATAIIVNDQEVTSESLIETLSRNVQRNPLVRVLIRADKEVRYEFLRRVLESVGSAGVGNVTFSVVDRDEGA